MVVSCAAYNCTNRCKNRCNRSFHRFPLQNHVLLGKWLAAIKRDKFTPTRHHRLCSDHFTDECFWKTNGKRLLKDDSVPSLFNFDTSSHHNKNENLPLRVLKRKVDEGLDNNSPTKEKMKEQIKEEIVDVSDVEPGYNDCAEEDNKLFQQQIKEEANDILEVDKKYREVIEEDNKILLNIHSIEK